MLNFGPWGVPFAYLPLGVVVEAALRFFRGLSVNDSRVLLLPFIVSVCLYFLIWDSDVTLYFVFTTGLLPWLIVWTCSRYAVSGVAHQFHGSQTL